MSAYYQATVINRAEIGRSATIHRPIARVRVIARRGGDFFEGRLDTGADDTILPWTAIEALGVELIPGKIADIEGLGGVERVMFGFVDLEFPQPGGPVRWSHLAAFSPGKQTLFGLRDFLDYFVARFDGPGREIRLRYRGGAPPPRFEPALPRRGG